MTTPEQESETLRSDVLGLVNNVDKVYFTLGEHLHNIAQNSSYTAWGFDTFDEYVESELGYRRRKAYDLKFIYEKAIELGIQEGDEAMDLLTKIGWTKALHILRSVVDRASFDKWATDALTLSVSELKDALTESVTGIQPAKKLGRDDDGNRLLEQDGERFRVVEVTFADAQYDNVSLAIKRAGAIAESTKKGHLLDMICLDFLANNADTENLGDMLAAWANRGFIELD